MAAVSVEVLAAFTPLESINRKEQNLGKQIGPKKLCLCAKTVLQCTKYNIT